jgi:UDP-glucose 4-epimerase
MHYLITGGAGFIGSHLAERLLREGHQVTVMDDLCTGSMHNIEHLKHRPGFEYVIDTIFNRPLLAELVDECDAIFHLAASVGVRLIVESPVHTIETNVKGTEGVLEFAAKKKKKVLVASTSEVYGKASKIPFSEVDDLVMGPTSKCRWSYACSKAIDEFLALAYWKEKKLPVVIARLFNTVGPRQTGRYGMVLPNFVRQALAGLPITVYGDGKQSRCFCHVSDTVEALSRLIGHPGAVGEIFNVGSEQEITIAELAAMVKTMTRSNSPIRFVPYDQAYEEGFEDMQRRVPDIGKIKKFINFRPSHSTQEIVESVIEYYHRESAPEPANAWQLAVGNSF